MFYQFVYNRVSAASDKNILEKINGMFWRTLRRLMSSVNDPLVKANVWKSDLMLPFTHDLPGILNRYPQYSANLLDITKCVKKKYPSLSVIDIGANIGDTIALIRKEESVPVLSIEGDDYFFSILQKNAEKFNHVSLEKSLVGNPEMSGKVIAKKGTAHIVQESNEEGTVRMKSLVEIVKQHPVFSSSKMLKIDTDGFDGIIIRGAKSFLEGAKPVIFFEYDPYFLTQQNDDGISIFTFLEGLGYSSMIVYDNFGNFLQGVDLSDQKTIGKIHNDFSGFGSKRYCDIAVFHKEDLDVYRQLNEK